MGKAKCELIETDDARDLTTEDRKEFRMRHARTKKNFSAFVQTAEDLHVIRTKRLYRVLNGYKTFKDYCKAEFDVTEQHGHHIADAGEVIVEIKKLNNCLVLPDNECQLRPFQRVPEGEAAKIWKQVVDEATKQNTVITGTFVKRIIDKHYPPKPKAAKEKVPSNELSDLLVRLANEVTPKDLESCSDDVLQSLVEKLHTVLSRRME